MSARNRCHLLAAAPSARYQVFRPGCFALVRSRNRWPERASVCRGSPRPRRAGARPEGRLSRPGFRPVCPASAAMPPFCVGTALERAGAAPEGRGLTEGIAALTKAGAALAHQWAAPALFWAGPSPCGDRAAQQGDRRAHEWAGPSPQWARAPPSWAGPPLQRTYEIS